MLSDRDATGRAQIRRDSAILSAFPTPTGCRETLAASDFNTVLIGRLKLADLDGIIRIRNQPPRSSCLQASPSFMFWRSQDDTRSR
jgi:hypothetical protein